MHCSKRRYTLENSGTVVLEFGQRCTHPDAPISGTSREANYVGAVWGRQFGNGQKRRSYSWSAVWKFSSPEDAESFVEMVGEYFPIAESETLLKEVEDGATVRVADFVLNSCTASVIPLLPLQVLVTFEGVGGEETIVDSGGLGGDSWDELDVVWNEPNRLNLQVSDQTQIQSLTRVDGESRYVTDSPTDPGTLWDDGTNWRSGFYPTASWTGPLSADGPMGDYTLDANPGIGITTIITVPEGADHPFSWVQFSAI